MQSSFEQQFVTVLSFSRSGSSLLARMLDEVCGISFGETIQFQSPTSANPEGYFEHEQIVALNDALLQAGGGSVFEPPDVNFCLRLSSHEFQEHLHRLKTVIELASAGRPYFGWKDPRTAYTLPLWRLAVPSVKAVILVRSPGASSASYEAQYGIKAAKASSLWFDSYFRIFLHSAGLERHVISFEALVARPAETLISLARFLGLSLDREEAETSVRKVLRPELIRFSSRREPDLFSAQIDPKAKLLFHYLQPFLEAGEQPGYEALGSLLSGLHTFERMYGHLTHDPRQQNAELPSGEGAASSLLQLVAERDEELRRLRTGLEHAERLAFDRLGELARYDQALKEAQSMVEARDQQISQLLIQLDERLKAPSSDLESASEPESY